MSEVVENSVVAVSSDKPMAVDVKKTRRTGIPVTGNVPWGTHFCQFYQTKEDLVEVLVPYFKAGLESNEFCMWVTSEPLSEEEAKEAMRKAVPDFDRYLKRGQIQIVPHNEWYLKDGVFNLQRVLNAWVNKLEQALAKGYDGLRVTGNTAWLEKKDWKNFADYEEEVNSVIGKYRMMVVCTYSIDKCSASEVINVVRSHQFALVKRRGEWELIESSSLKRAKVSLRETEERYRELTESISDVFFAMDKDLRYTYWNKAFKKLMGVSAKDAVGKSLTEVFPDVKGTKVERFYIETLRTQQPQSMVNEYQLGGENFVLEISAYPTKDGLSVFVKDITQRRKAEELLQKSEEKLRTIINSMQDLVFSIDMDGNFRSYYQSSHRPDLYRSPEEFVGKNFREMLPPDVADLLQTAIKKIKASGKPQQFDYSLKIEDKELWFDASLSPVKDKSGCLTEITTVVRNITERKDMEEQLKQYSEHLEEKVEERTKQLKNAQEQLIKVERLAAIGEVATMVGHDLRNPLQSIENAAYYLSNELQFLAPSLPNPQETMEMLQAINNSVNYAAKIIRDLQDFSATKTPILKKANINNIVRDTLQQTQTPNNVELRTEMGSLQEIELDEDQIKRAFMNLAANGIQAMENGGGTLTVSTKQTEGFVEITFKDTGEGISKENLPKLYAPLFTTKAKGMGLGLPICKKFVENHGGTINVESKIAKGTAVTVKLPIPKKQRR